MSLGSSTNAVPIGILCPKDFQAWKDAAVWCLERVTYTYLTDGQGISSMEGFRVTLQSEEELGLGGPP